MQLALDANRALQKQMETVKRQIDKFVEQNAEQIGKIKELRVNPSVSNILCPF